MITLTPEDGGFSLSLDGRAVARHSRARPLLSAGYGEATFKSSHGSFKVREKSRKVFDLRDHTIARSGENSWTVKFSGFGDVLFSEREGTLSIEFEDVNPGVNRLVLRLLASAREGVFGCGEQYSHFNLRGRRVPLWSEEQGVGRGANPMRLAAEITADSGGSTYSTYYALPSFVTSENLFFTCRSTAFARFDFRNKSSHALEFWEIPTGIRIGVAPDLPSLVGSLARLNGIQPRLPEWAHDGLILGAQGGTEAVLAKLETVLDAGTPVSALWVQDWEGKRITSFGYQLFWNWAADESLYPDLKNTIRALRAKNVRMLGYINPFLAIEGPLYAEAHSKGYCVKSEDGSDCLVSITSFPAALVDLTNPLAFSWIKSIIKNNMIGIGLSGWMADFGESLPVEAVLHSGESGETAHNKYPTLWAKANREAILEAGMEDELLVFHRSGHAGTQEHVSTFWAGDQLVNWYRDDGIPSVIPAALSLGLCGVGQWHADLGGYTTAGWVKRSPELLMRWAELAAFAPVMRSHEGNRPLSNAQAWSDARIADHLARMGRLFSAMKPYALSLAAEYRETGLPFLRPIFLHYPKEPQAWKQAYSFLYGKDMLVAPVVKKGRASVRAYLPDDEWIHLWTGEVYTRGWHTVPAHLGYPAVFYRKNSRFTALFDSIRTALAARTLA